MSSIDFSTINLNEIMIKAIKYEKIKNKQKEHTMNYSKRKREEKDVNFIEKQKQYAKNYYEKNKEKIDKKNLERYYNKKNSVMSVEVN
jgi:hypothetical protein